MTIPGPADLPGALTASAGGIHTLEAARTAMTRAP